MPIASLLYMILANVIGRILFSFGVTIVSYTGMALAIDTAFEHIRDMITLLPENFLSLMGIVNADLAFNLIVSSYVAAITTRGTFLAVGRMTGNGG